MNFMEAFGNFMTSYLLVNHHQNYPDLNHLLHFHLLHLSRLDHQHLHPQAETRTQETLIQEIQEIQERQETHIETPVQGNYFVFYLTLL
jgi:hypothetical protein